MSVRTPDKDLTKQAEAILSQLEAGAKEVEQEKWHKYKIEVITPIFGGGVKAGVPDTQMPIRASAIRGQLRYWWRFLAKNRRVDPLSGEKLFEKEREIWGGMSEPGEDYSSKVRIKITLLSKLPDPAPYINQHPQYALFPARKTQDDEKTKELIWIDFNNKLLFELQLCVPEEYLTEVEHTLRWWVTFGGIGARTRRGCGSIYSTELDPVSKIEASAVGCDLILQTNIKDSALDAWKNAINCLQKFRQGEDIGRNGKYGGSKWPEPDSIRQITDSYSGKVHRDGCRNHLPKHPARIAFPRAAFGLPIVFEKATLVPTGNGGKGRLSSPIILTAYPVRKKHNGQPDYVSAALVTKKRGHVDSLMVSLINSDGDVIKSFNGNESWRAIQQSSNGTDALTAFMNFFANGGV